MPQSKNQSYFRSMKLGRRLRIYLVGVGMGLVAVYFIFSTRGCEWLPGNRVITLIEECLVQATDKTLCEMECNGLDKKDVFNLIQSGEVNFSESETGGDVKEYVLESDSLKCHSTCIFMIPQQLLGKSITENKIVIVPKLKPI